MTSFCTTISFTGNTVTFTVIFAISSPAAKTNSISIVPSHSGMFTCEIDRLVSELFTSNILSLSLTNCASKNTTSSPSGSYAKISGVMVTEACWSRFISGNGLVTINGIPSLITENSSQSENEWSSILSSILAAPGESIEPSTEHDATPLCR